MPVTNLDLHFLKTNDQLQLEVYTRGDETLLLSTNLDIPDSLLSGFELRQLDFQVKNPQERVNNLREFGRRLYDAVFTAELKDIWSQLQKSNEFAVLCIRIAPEVVELEAIPWETLFDGEEFVAAGIRTTISRLPLDIAPQMTLPAVPLPVKMLALVSSPLDLAENSRLQMEREQEILLEAINDPAGQGRLRVDFEDEAKLEILESSLETPYQIFHFTGHGIEPEGEDGGGLLLEDARGNSRPASASEVIQSLRRGEQHLRLAMLSGCQTARTLNVAGFRDMGRELLRCGVPSVIAMQFSISDSGGLKFAEIFYSKLAEGRSLELASHAARRALRLSDDPYLQADALASVLLTANGDCLQTAQSEMTLHSAVPKIDYSFFLPLPQLSHGFYGRRRESRQIRNGIMQRNQRAVIVHGIGGIGKTALVSHVATRLRKHFQGIYALDCSGGMITPETVMIKLNQYFQALGIKVLEPLLYTNLSPDVLATHLAQALSQWSLLLIFDNFESQLKRNNDKFEIADENLRTFITTLVKATATKSHFLFTSRYLFEIDDRRLGAIQALPLEDLSRPEALSLMQKLQHLAAATYEEKLDALAAFGGHPYALVTLDRYCNHQPLAQALKEARSIHRELRAFLTIELNYAQLSDRSAELLKGLAAFRKSVPHEAAQWVLGKRVPPATELVEEIRSLSEEIAAMDESEFQKLLTQTLPEHREASDIIEATRELVDWGLVTPIHEDDKLRELSVHALVRDFCREKQTGDIWLYRLRDAASFYTNLTKLQERKQKSPTEIWSEMEAFELLIDAGEFDEAATLLVNAGELLNRWGFVQYLESQYRRLLEKVNQSSTAYILHNLGTLVQTRGDYEQALHLYERSLTIEEALGNRKGMASSLHQLGWLRHVQGDYDKASELYERSLKISEELGNRNSVASSLHQIGMIHQDQGDLDGALKFYERSIEIHEQLGERLGTSCSLHQIGLIYQAHGDYEKALSYYEDSLKIEEEFGNQSGLANSFHAIGMILHEAGKYEEAMKYYEQCLAIMEDLDDRSGVANSHGRISMLMSALGRYDEALRHTFIAFNICMELQSPNVGVAVADLRAIRARWGMENFDKAWNETTGEYVPEWLTEE